MKISRHANGTYSITEMTHNDFSKLSFGVCSDAAFQSRGFPDQNEQGRQWEKTERDNAVRLNNVMYAMENAAGSGSITVTSATSYGDPDAFYVEKINKVHGWENDDITSHLKRKEGN
jgi:hypothetical protein